MWLISNVNLMVVILNDNYFAYGGAADLIVKILNF